MKKSKKDAEQVNAALTRALAEKLIIWAEADLKPFLSEEAHSIDNDCMDDGISYNTVLITMPSCRYYIDIHSDISFGHGYGVVESSGEEHSLPCGGFSKKTWREIADRILALEFEEKRASLKHPA